MPEMNMLEIIGYIGSALVVISMLMSSIIRLRIINTVGSIISAIYALFCGAIPLALMNICLIVINVYNLVKVLKSEKSYELIKVDSKDAFLRAWLSRYDSDIKVFFKTYDMERVTDSNVYMITFEGNPVGVTAGHIHEDSIQIIIDYTIPAFRDCSVGRYLYAHLKTEGISTLYFKEALTDAHADYLKKMGYVKQNDYYKLCI